MSKNTVTAVITLLVLGVSGIYTYLTIQDGGAIGATVPFAIYVVYISFYYHKRVGWIAAGVCWVITDVCLTKPVGAFKLNPSLVLLAGWFLLIVELGVYAGRYKRWKDREIDKREMYSSVAAHELKTPITVLKIRVGLLKKSDPVLGNILVREVDRLQTLIERMMNYSKISTGKYELVYTKFRIDELVVEVTSNIQNVNTTAKIRTNIVEKPIEIEADQTAVEQILINVLNNAVKHCPTKQIDVTLRRRNNHWVQIVVQDRGDGIPKEVQKKIFKPFTQGSNASPGLGMGLYIVRQLVDLHKGLVYFHSNKGTTFFVELPINQRVKDKRPKYRI